MFYVSKVLKTCVYVTNINTGESSKISKTALANYVRNGVVVYGASTFNRRGELIINKYHKNLAILATKAVGTPVFVRTSKTREPEAALYLGRDGDYFVFYDGTLFQFSEEYITKQWGDIKVTFGNVDPIVLARLVKILNRR